MRRAQCTKSTHFAVGTSVGRSQTELSVRNRGATGIGVSRKQNRLGVAGTKADVGTESRHSHIYARGDRGIAPKSENYIAPKGRTLRTTVRILLRQSNDSCRTYQMGMLHESQQHLFISVSDDTARTFTGLRNNSRTLPHRPSQPFGAFSCSCGQMSRRSRKGVAARTAQSPYNVAQISLTTLKSLKFRTTFSWKSLRRNLSGRTVRSTPYRRNLRQRTPVQQAQPFREPTARHRQVPHRSAIRYI